jgi:hypothetical protein
MRRECLDGIIVFARRQLRHVLLCYNDFRCNPHSNRHNAVVSNVEPVRGDPQIGLQMLTKFIAHESGMATPHEPTLHIEDSETELTRRNW